MKHFILTRFNGGTGCLYGHSPEVQLGINETWLEKRLKIFKEITIPSVENQTEKDFIWILRCHPQTPAWARQMLVGNFVACYDEDDLCKITDIKDLNPIDVIPQIHAFFSKAIRKITNDKEIITTRLDSDDAIASHYVEKVQKYIKMNKFFDFSRGIVKSDKGIFMHQKLQTSQFCSYLESSQELKTVYQKAHPKIDRKDCIVNQVDWGWMQNNHDANIALKLKVNRKYPIQATEIDLETIKQLFPMVNRTWFKAKPKNNIKKMIKFL